MHTCGSQFADMKKKNKKISVGGFYASKCMEVLTKSTAKYIGYENLNQSSDEEDDHVGLK